MSPAVAPTFSAVELDRVIVGLRAFGDAAPWDGSLLDVLEGLASGWDEQVDALFDDWLRVTRAAGLSRPVAHAHIRRARQIAIDWLEGRIEHLIARGQVPDYVDSPDSAARILLAFETTLRRVAGVPCAERRAAVMQRVAVELAACARRPAASAQPVQLARSAGRIVSR